MAAVSEVLALEEGKYGAERVNLETGVRMLRGNIERFLSKTGDRSGPLLLSYSKSDKESGVYSMGRKFSMDRAELEALERVLINEQRLDEKNSKATRRTDYDEKKQKLIPNSYTEFRNYFTDISDLVFKRIQVVKDGAVNSVEWSINSVHKQPLVKPGLPPKKY